MGKRERILYVVNDPAFFLSHRLALARAARDAGYEVHVATPEGVGVDRIRALGFPFHRVRMDRAGVASCLGTLVSVFRLYRRLRPDLVHHVTLKPVLLGGVAARLTRIPAVVQAVTGGGFLFSDSSWRARCLRGPARLLFRLAASHPNVTAVFQNPDDLRDFAAAARCDPARATIIRGSGVDPAEFAPTPEPSGDPVAILPARMLVDKGVQEFVAAAGRLRARGLRARFALVGDVDPGNPRSLRTEELRAWHESGTVEWWGRRGDMPAVYAASHVVCLPSYREGVPRALIEAASCGRPVVAADAPGCREIVAHGENGLLVAPRDVGALAEALARVLGDTALRIAMGARGRERVLREFSLARVIAQTLAVYERLLAARRPSISLTALGPASTA